METTFPRKLVHPRAREAQLGLGWRDGSPGFLAPVIVNNQDQYDYYISRGYIDPMVPQKQYVFQPYPKWVEGQIVQNAEEEKALLVRNHPEQAEVPETNDSSASAAVQDASERESGAPVDFAQRRKAYKPKHDEGKSHGSGKATA